jgi:murein DD-endopeptidase MepM/ murein hydrolase activator NlpD
MIKFLAFILVFLQAFSNLFSQKNLSTDFISPLNIPLFLSGNYGELRTGHFHSGIDIKTQGVIGKPVFAAEEGYIARIKIQSGGYGNALYIAHPNGYTTVYAHLDRFIIPVQEYVESQQYEKQKFEIELFPKHDQFVFNQGDVIAYSGNTGRSGGPHLHFEVRKSNGQVPMNGLQFNLPVADNIPPAFKGIYVYNLSENMPVGNNGDPRDSFSAVKKNDSTYRIEEIIPIRENYFGLGTEVYDYLNGSGNRCGIYTLDYYLDGKFQYGFTVDNISFANTRYINAHMDYALKSAEGISVHRLFSLPNNRLPIYRSANGKGVLSLSNDSLHSVRIEASDVYGNKSVLLCDVRKLADTVSIPGNVSAGERVNWFEGGVFDEGPFRMTIPPASLYNDIIMDISLEEGISLLHDTLRIHTIDEPLHKNLVLRVVLDSAALQFKDKLIFARIDEQGKAVSEGGECIDSKLITSTRNFGKYFLMVDTVKPTISPLKFISGGKYTAGQRITFQVADEQAGIHSYNAYVDGQWVLLKYDAKSDTMFYTLDEKRIAAGNWHKLVIEVKDEKGNLASYSDTFYF